jgi:hypothetical protein
MPTTATDTYTPDVLTPIDPEQALCLPVKLLASTTYYKGQVLEESATPGIFQPYAHGDGIALPKCALRYAVTTDSAGNAIVMGFGAAQNAFSAYFTGTFKTSDLCLAAAAAIDANTVSDSLTWKMLQGSVTAGLINIG